MTDVTDAADQTDPGDHDLIPQTESREPEYQPGKAWVRPALQVPGLLLWGLGMVIGFFVQKPRPTPAVDMAILEFFARHRVDWLVSVSHFIEIYDGPKVTPWLLVGALVVIFLRGHRMLAIMTVFMAALSWLPGHIAKSLYPRPRPPASIDPVWKVLGDNSYPSGHTGLVAAATVAGMFALTVLGHTRARKWWLVGGMVLVTIVGLSRMYVGVHYPSDVLGGAALATGMSLFLWPIWAGIQAWVPLRVGFLGDTRLARRRAAEGLPAD